MIHARKIEIFGVKVKLIFQPVKELKNFVTERQQLAGKRPLQIVASSPYFN